MTFTKKKKKQTNGARPFLRGLPVGQRSERGRALCQQPKSSRGIKTPGRAPSRRSSHAPRLTTAPHSLRSATCPADVAATPQGSQRAGSRDRSGPKFPTIVPRGIRATTHAGAPASLAAQHSGHILGGGVGWRFAFPALPGVREVLTRVGSSERPPSGEDAPPELSRDGLGPRPATPPPPPPRGVGVQSQRCAPARSGPRSAPSPPLPRRCCRGNSSPGAFESSRGVPTDRPAKLPEVTGPAAGPPAARAFVALSWPPAPLLRLLGAARSRP